MPGIPVVTEHPIKKTVQAMTDAFNGVIENALEPEHADQRIGRAVVAGHEAMLKDLPENRKSSDSTEIQREDLVRLVSVTKGLSDAGGNELSPRQGISPGAIYRIFKVHQTLVVLPDKPDELTKIVQYYEAIDDSSARPELVTLFPHEIVLHKKRDKAHSVVKVVFSEFLKCSECGDTNALVLNGSTFKGDCQKCGHHNEIERMIELCSNEKCVDSGKKRTQVSLFLYDGKFQGSCGTCKTPMVKEGAVN